MAFFAGLFGWILLFGISVTDVSQLLPAQVLVITREEDGVTVETDNGVTGRGADLPDAMDRAEQSAPGKLFLETAEKIVLVRPDGRLLRELVREDRLRPASRVYQTETKVCPEELVDFLRAHPGGVRLVELKAGAQEIPALPAQEKERTDAQCKAETNESMGAGRHADAGSHGADR